MVSLVEKTIAEEPFEWRGFKWAAKEQSFYAEKLGVSTRQVSRYIADPPFVTRRARVGDGPIVINGSTQISGPRTPSLIRLGESSPDDLANEAKLVTIKLWNKTIGKPVTFDQGCCLWGMAVDVIKLLADEGLPAVTGRELMIAVFKHALADWNTVAGALKFAAEARPGYKPRFYDYPCIPHIRSFYKAAVHAYVMHLQMEKVKPPAALEFLANPLWSQKILTLTDPLADHPGLTPEIDDAINAGSQAAANKAGVPF